MTAEDGDLTTLDLLVLSRFPYPIAVAYRRILNEPDWTRRIILSTELFDSMLRFITLGIVNQYVISDAQVVNDERLNELIIRILPRPSSLGIWKSALFTAVQAYEGHRDRFFMQDMFERFIKPSKAFQRPYDEFIRRRNSAFHGLSPKTNAEWESVGSGVLTDLRTILEHFSFLQNYDLIYITGRDVDTYDYVRYTGENPEPRIETHISEEFLRTGWLYLSRENRTFLQLHPLLIFWEEMGELDLPGRHLTDAALYNAFTRTAASYLAVVLQHSVQERAVALGAIQELYKRVEELQRARTRGEGLSWEEVRRIARMLTETGFADARSGDAGTRYFRRAVVEQRFDQFLGSDQHGFVLLGRSGVGKSLFLQAFADAHRDDVATAILLYNGPLIEVGRPLAEKIEADFEQFIGRSADDPRLGFLDSVTALGGMGGRRLIVAIDAINENPNARDLLFRIDEFLALCAGRYPWIDVVLSSRPEAWKVLKRRVRLHQHLYFRPDSSGDLVVEVQPYSSEELPDVYDHYRTISDRPVLTAYADISPTIRELLRDPLTLRVVADTYRGQPLPASIRPGEIYERYVQQLVAEERLLERDIYFLEHDLMPLMISEGHYENTISPEQIVLTTTSSGARLMDLIEAEDIDPRTGRPANQSFQDLVNAGILASVGSVVDAAIRFVHERFYDYYAGKRLAAIADGQTERMAFYARMIHRIGERTYLWGGVKSALVSEGKSGHTDMLIELSAMDDARTRDMMTAVITDLGRDDRAVAEAILHRLIQPPDDPGTITRAWRLARRKEPDVDIDNRSAKLVAVEAAGALGITWVLFGACLDSDSAVRSAGVRAGYHLWTRDPNAGYSVLRDVSERVMHGLVPDLAAFDAIFGLSFIIFFDAPHDADVLHNLQDIWRGVITRVLGLGGSQNRAAKMARSVIRERVYGFAINLAFKALREMPKYNMANYPDLDAFFHLPPEERELYRRLLRYISAGESFAVEEVRADCLAALKVHNLLMSTVVLFVCKIHVVREPETYVPLVRELFSRALAEESINQYVQDLVDAPAFLLRRNPFDNAAFEFLVEAATACQRYYMGHTGVPGMARTVYSPQAMYFGPYIRHQYEREGTVRTEWLESRVARAVAESDTAFFDFLLTTELPQVGIEFRLPYAALETLGLFVHAGGPAVEGMTLDLLARMRTYFPDEVEDFLDQHQFSREAKLTVETNTPAESVGGLMGFRIWVFLENDVLIASDELRAVLVRILAQALEARDLRAWLDTVIREVVNLVYGDEALPLSG